MSTQGEDVDRKQRGYWMRCSVIERRNVELGSAGCDVLRVDVHAGISDGGVFENSQREITFKTQRLRAIYRGSEPQDTGGQYKYFTMDGHEWGSMRGQSWA